MRTIISRETWSKEDDDVIIGLYEILGDNWCRVSRFRNESCKLN